MALKKFPKEGPSIFELGELLLKFAGMLVMKIIVFIILRETYRYVSKFFRPKTKGTEENAKDKDEVDGYGDRDRDPVEDKMNNEEDGRNQLYERQKLELLAMTLSAIRSRQAKETAKAK